MSKINPPQPATQVQLLPTPPVGFPVRYYKDDMMGGEKCAAAICVEELGPGRCMLVVFEPHTVPYYKTGVNWAGDQRRETGARPFRLNGVWDFLDDMKPRNATRLHKEQLERQEKDRLAREEQLARDMAAKEERLARMRESISQETS